MVSDELRDQPLSDTSGSESSQPSPDSAPSCNGRGADDVTQILSAIEDGDSRAAEQLLPLIYEELRKLAAAKMAREDPGQTLQATALVHEAYLRLVEKGTTQHWNSRGHFFAAAAEAMRRILVENARRRKRQKRGGGLQKVDIDEAQIAAPAKSSEIVAVDQALEALEARNAVAAQIVKLRYFVGMTNHDAAEALKISPRKANQIWVYARTWLLEHCVSEGITLRKL
jgi:RNA polymerase sigma factor (TIGR02999 family)